MFWNNITRRRLESLLQPWLREEPELELKLGIINSHAIARNLRFDTAVLNELIDEPGGLFFIDVTIEQLTVRFSNWSVPAFSFEVHGFNVTLSAGDLNERRNSRKVHKHRDFVAEEVKKKLSQIDPEGIFLHSILEKISRGSTSRNKFKTAFLNVILKHCQLQLYNLNVQVQLPLLNDSGMFVLHLDELNAESEYSDFGCLLRGFAGALFLPEKERSYLISGTGFEIVFKRVDQVNQILLSTYLTTCMKLNDLQLVDFSLRVQELGVFFTPADLSMFLTFGTVLSKESQCARNGRQLWKLAASRVRNVTSAHRLTLYKSIVIARLWLRYLKAYEYMLQLIGYSADHLLRRSITKMSRNKMFLGSVKQQWKVLSDTEKELPVESISQARRIARSRAALNVHSANSKEFPANTLFKVFSRIFPLLAFIWRLVLKLFYSMCLILFRRKWAKEPNTEHLEPLNEGDCPRFCFILNIGRILVTISHINGIQSAVRKLESHVGVSFSDFFSYSFSTCALLLEYNEAISEQSLIVSCGQIKVQSSSLKETSNVRSSSKDFLSYMKGYWRGSNDDFNSILWSEPAQTFPLTETCKMSSADYAEGACDPFVENFLGEMWMNWKRACMKFEKIDIDYSESPTLLCETKRFLTYPNPSNSDSGFWKCFFTLGKLNLVLGCSSILSISVLLRQIQHALGSTGDNRRSKVILNSPRTMEDLSESNWDRKYKRSANSLKMVMLKMLPEKHIQLGVFMAGPSIKVSLEKEFSGGNENSSHIASHDCFHLSFDIHNIEVAIWPSSTSDSASHLENLGGYDAELYCTRLKQPQRINIPKSDNEYYASKSCIFLASHLRFNGFNAYLGNSTEKQKSHIFVLQPMTIQFSSLREYVHSFSSNVVALSAALSWTAAGFTVLSFMDEFYILSQVVIKLDSVASRVLSSFNFTSSVPSENMIQKFALVQSENEETTVERPPSIYSSTVVLIDGILKIKSADIILQNSRINGDLESWSVSSKKLSEPDLANGILISIQETSVNISGKNEKLEICTDFSEIQSIIFRYQNEGGPITNSSVLEKHLVHPHNCLYEISLSKCMFTLSLFLPQNGSSESTHNDLDGSTSTSGSNTSSVDNFPFTGDAENLGSERCNFAQKLGFASNIPAPDISHWLVVNVELGMVYMARCSLKNDLVEAHEVTKLLSSFCVGREFKTISWETQGGFLFLESTALETFICCLVSYLHSIPNRFFGVQSFEKGSGRTEGDVHMTRLDNLSVNEFVQCTPATSSQAKEKLTDAFNVKVSQLSTALVIGDEEVGVRELLVKVDVNLSYESKNMTRRFMFELPRLSILSQVLKKGNKNEIRIPHFSSVTSDNMSTHLLSGDPASLQPRDVIIPISDPSCSRDSDSLNGLSAETCAPEVSNFCYQKYILERLSAFISAQKPLNGPLCLNQAWVGSGSISGFDITISLSVLEMVLFTVSSFSGVFSKTTTSELNKKHRSQESDSGVEAMVPDGSIVAIQDVHQHMYFVVDGEDNKYSLGGTVHYSLVGERALFRVKYHKKWRWSSSILWFSLTSLHTQNTSGESLQLNYRPGSGFVDISSTDDGTRALWRILSCEPKNYEGDTNWEPYNQLIKRTFYIMNKKSDCAVAFIGGIPEFVRKPGNPFKFKVFHEISVPRDAGKFDNYNLEDSRTTSQDNVRLNETNAGGKISCIEITFDEISLTVVHEHSDTNDMFPLLRGSINNTQFIVQILSNKARVISISRAAIYHFDSQRNSWRELLHPVEICLFYRSNFHTQSSGANLHVVPTHIHCRTKELTVSVSEISLDILLFVIGKLNLAGPYSLRTSRILANCCKVENQSGLILICHIFNKESVKIARNQSTDIFLRYSDLANQSPEIASIVSFQLACRRSLRTSSIHISLLQAQTLAWRTRITSVQGSRTYPGPFVVVDVSRESEDGLSVVISPLIRIHNETRFPMELQFQRPQQKEDERASVVIKPGDTIDDSMAMFDATHVSGGLKKALTSLSLGNFLFSFRPEITDSLMNSKNTLSVEWSNDLKGGKAFRLSGIFDKLGYKVRKALFTKSVNCSFSTAQCSLHSEGSRITYMHFLIQSIWRDVPVAQPNKSTEGFEYSNSSVALQEQKEIFLLPTVKVSNLLQLEIQVLLSEMDPCLNVDCDEAGNQAIISCGSSTDFYVNPAIIYFTITLTTYKSSCKPVNSSDWIKKLLKQKGEVHHLDIDLDFGGGNYFASLRLFRDHRGILEATVFTSYSLKNETDFSLYFFAPNRKPLPRHELEKLGSEILPELGLLLPPQSTRSWFLKSNKVCLKLLEDNASEVPLDLDALSGLTEISLEIEESIGVKSVAKLGVSMGPLLSKVVVPSQLVTMVPRYVVVNESEGTISIRQCHLQDDRAGIITLNSKQRTTLQLWNWTSKRREFSIFEKLMKKHGKANDDALMYIQFRPDESELGWSGPLCIASMGRFFLKFKKQQSDQVTPFAAVHIVEEGSTLVLHFHKPPKMNLPYRIENFLRDFSITYYQKDSSEQEILGSSCSVDYVWDDLTLPHKLVVQINDSHSPLLREINLDKVRGWKPFYKHGLHRGLAYHFLLDKKSESQTRNASEHNAMEMVRIGYEVYADGLTRVLRCCEISENHKEETVFQSCEKIQLRVPQFTIHLLEQGKQDGDEREASIYAPIIAAKVGNLSLDSVFTDQQKYNQINLQSMILEQKWVGAPFAAMLRRHRSDSNDTNDCLLRIVVVLLSTSSEVIQVKYSSVALQPIDLNIDEETLMRLVPFWRKSLSDSNTKSRQFYFDHFEIQPIKIIANFLPGESYSSYSSAQETLRSLLHSVIKVPPIKNMVVELNGVLVTHALITMRELFIRCAQHYSWYAMRAIYIAKGSPLLPPDFVSMFDDLASSSLDVFFDPSRGLINLPGFTLGTFKFISKCIDGKGFSGTKRYFGDLGNSLQTAGSNVLFAAITEISDSVLKGAEASGFNGMVTGFHQGILKLAMEPSLLGSALLEGGPDRKIKLDQSPGVDELYVEGYLQAMLDTLYRQEYLRVRVIDDQVYLKNLPPNNTLIEEIVDNVKAFLVSKALLKGDPSRTSHSLRHLRRESEWRFGPTLLTLCEHLLVSFAIRTLRKHADKLMAGIKWKKNLNGNNEKAISLAKSAEDEQRVKFIWKWGIGKFVLSGIVAYIDGRLCRCIPNPIARHIVSGFLLTFLDKRDE
ncbi:hypothetical protein UlMin_039423 [Ulmus minor]